MSAARSRSEKMPGHHCKTGQVLLNAISARKTNNIAGFYTQ
jgi:hypothetical protein